MNLNQTRVVDPILTEHARGYRKPGNVGKKLFPVCVVPSYGGKVIQFDKAAFRLHSAKRAPGTATKRIESGYAGVPYAIVPSALEASVPRERMVDAAQVPGIDLARDAVDVTLSSIELEHEYDSAQLARNAAAYDADHKVALVGAARWTGADGDPVKDVKTAIEAVRASIGVRPNLVVLAPTAFNACEFNPKVLDRIKYTGRDSVTTEILAKLFGVAEVVVGEAVVATGANDAFGDIWGDDVIVAYVAPSASSDGRRNSAEPSYGYTYSIEGMPSVENPYWDNSTKSWIYGVSNDCTPVVSGITAGYLIQNAGAPAA